MSRAADSCSAMQLRLWAQIVQLLFQYDKTAVKPPLDCPYAHSEARCRLRVRHSLNSHQTEHLSLFFRQTVDRLQHAACIGSKSRIAAVWRDGKSLRKFNIRNPFIQASGQVIQLPADVLVRQGKELTDRLRSGL